MLAKKIYGITGVIFGSGIVLSNLYYLPIPLKQVFKENENSLRNQNINNWATRYAFKTLFSCSFIALSLIKGGFYGLFWPFTTLEILGDIHENSYYQAPSRHFKLQYNYYRHLYE